MPDDVKPAAEYAMPQNLQEWRQAKDEAYRHSLEVLGDSIGLAEGAIGLACDLFSAVEQIDPNDPRAAALVMMLGATSRLLLNALDLLVERQPLDAYAVLRPAIEIAADAAKIGDKPALAMVWANRSKEEGEYNKAFKPQFPKGHALTGPLYGSYQLTCNFGSHGGPNVVALHVETEKPSGGGKGALRTAYFIEDDQQMRQYFVHFVVTVKRIMNVYAAALMPISKRDLSVRLKLWQSMVDVHRKKYRDLFVKAESNPPSSES